MSQLHSMTEYQLFEIFIDEERKCRQGVAPLANSFPTIQNLLAVKELSEDQKTSINNLFRKFKHQKAKFSKKGGYSAILDGADKSESVLQNLTEHEVVMEDERPPKKKKRELKLKGLDEVGRKQLKRRTNELFKSVQELATKENVSVARILGFLLTRSPESEKLREIGESIWNNGSPSSVESNSIPVESCLVLYNDCKLGRQTYTKQKKVLENAGFKILPSWRHLRVKQKEITPAVQKLPEPFVGVFYSLFESVRLTVQRMLPTVGNNLMTNLQLNIKFGFDGSGSHSIFNQQENEQTMNIIMSMFCPLELKTEAGSSVWVQPSPNSPYTQRPVCLQMGKESEESLQSLKIFNDDIAKMKDDGMVVQHGGSTAYNVKVDIISHMMDMKAAHLYLGLGGAYCDLCTCSKEQCLDVERIEGGFTINRNVEDLLNLFDNHLGLEDGTVMKSKGDYDIRAGQTARAIPTNETQSVQVLHALLRSFDFVMKVIVHILAGVYDWSESKSSHNNRFLVAAKGQLQQEIFSFTTQKWDFPDATGKGGTTTTGNTARVLLYRNENRDFIVSKLPERHRETLKNVMMMFSVICRVMSSKGEVNIQEYKDYCMKLNLILVNDFPRVVHQHLPGPWISITPAVHKLLAHTWELMQNNDNRGLGSLDESGLEGCNKILRSVRINLSRRVSQTLNLVDCINRMWVSSDPSVNNEREKTRPYCTHCDERGHSIRYCVKKNIVDTASTEEEMLISMLTSQPE